MNFEEMYNRTRNITRAELNIEIEVLLGTLRAREGRINKTLVCMANTISDIPGNRGTAKQRKYWEILEKRLKE